LQRTEPQSTTALHSIARRRTAVHLVKAEGPVAPDVKLEEQLLCGSEPVGSDKTCSYRATATIAATATLLLTLLLLVLVAVVVVLALLLQHGAVLLVDDQAKHQVQVRLLERVVAPAAHHAAEHG
jgi:hypothetical protein